MKFEGDVVINAPRGQVYTYLTNPDFVSQCAPGLKSMEVVVPDEKFKAVASIGFGTVKVTFKNDVEFVERIEPELARIKVHGTAPGSAVDLTSAMRLTDTTDGMTNLHWEADVQIVGKIASLAARLMGSVTKKLSSAFFECVKSQIEAG